MSGRLWLEGGWHDAHWSHTASGTTHIGWHINHYQTTKPNQPEKSNTDHRHHLQPVPTGKTRPQAKKNRLIFNLCLNIKIIVVGNWREHKEDIQQYWYKIQHTVNNLQAPVANFCKKANYWHLSGMKSFSNKGPIFIHFTYFDLTRVQILIENCFKHPKLMVYIKFESLKFFMDYELWKYE